MTIPILTLARATLDDHNCIFDRYHYESVIQELLAEVERLEKVKKEGWDAFYRMRKSVAQEKWPTLTGVVKTL